MSIQRISVGAGGVQGNGASGIFSPGGTSISSDGRFISFYSDADNLVVGDTNVSLDAFVRDMLTGQTTLISTLGSGVQGNAMSQQPSLTADGHFVVFWSDATNLSPSDHNGAWDVFLKDTQTGAVTLITTALSGDSGNGASYGPSITPNGRFVTFQSASSDLVNGDTAGHWDVFLKDLQNGSLTLVSTNTALVQANGDSFNATASNDGRYVAFMSDANNLVSNDPNGAYDVFVKDLTTGEMYLAATNALGAHGDGQSAGASLSGDGHLVAFHSFSTNLATGDGNAAADVFVKNILTNEIRLASSNAAGIEGNADSLYPTISANGRYVAFQSTANNLVDGDTNGVSDVFVKDLTNGHIVRISNNAAGQQGDGASDRPEISDDGRFVAFRSLATNLTAGDTNGTYDVFRVDLAESGFWQGAEKVGGNVQVNTTTAGSQFSGNITPLGAHKFLATWGDTTNGARMGQVLDASGAKVGSEFTIFSASGDTELNQLALANGRVLVMAGPADHIARIVEADGQLTGPTFQLPNGLSGYIHSTALSNGGFVVAASVDGYVNIGIQAYDASGSKIGSQFTIGSGTFNEFVVKDVVEIGNGSYALLYKSPSNGAVVEQLFNTSGVPIGAPITVSDNSAALRWDGDIDAVHLSDGRVFVAWSQAGSSGSDIYGRFLDANGAPLGTPFAINSTVAGTQFNPHAVETANGNIAVVWREGNYGVSWDVGTNTAIRGQILDHTGAHVGSQFDLTTGQTVARDLFLAPTGDGGVFFTWRAYDANGEGAFARYITSDGVVATPEILINSATSGNQYAASVAANADGTVVALFNDYAGQDGSGLGVFAQVLTLNGNTLPPACFLAGTAIRTATGETPVESLAIGDLVTTADGRALPVRFIGRQTIVSRFCDPLTAHPVCISAGALGPNLPARDLYSSPGHAMLLDGVLVIAGALVNGTSICRMARPPERFTYFHIELDEHAVIFAEGAATETFCDNVPREIFDNAAAHKALYPDVRPIIQLDLPTVKSARQLPAAMRRRLSERAVAIGAATRREAVA